MSNTSNLQRYFHRVKEPYAPSQHVTDSINNTINYDEAEDEDCFSDCSIIISPCSLSSHSSSLSLNSQFSIQDSTLLDFSSATDSKPESAGSQQQQLSKKPLFSLFNTSTNFTNSHKNPNASSDSISTVVLSNNLFQDSNELNRSTTIVDDDKTEQQNLSPSFCNAYSFQDNINPSSLTDDDSTDELSQVDFSDLDRSGSSNILSANSDMTTSRSTLSSAENLFEKFTAISNSSDTPRSSVSHSTITSPPTHTPNSTSTHTKDIISQICGAQLPVDEAYEISRSLSRSSSYSSACSTSSNVSLKSSMRSPSCGSLTLKKRVSFALNDLEDVCFFDKYGTPRSVSSTSDEEEYSEEEEEGTEEEEENQMAFNYEKVYSNDMFNNYFNLFDILSKNVEDENYDGCWKMYRKNFSIGNYDKKLGNNNIKLEKLSVKNNIMYGHVLVSNLAFEKQVGLKYTTNNWATFNQINLYFKNCKDSNTDRFSFKLNLNSKKFQRLQRQHSSLNFEFCLCYLVNNYKYWDNNNNLNYKLKLYKSENNDIEYGHNRENSSNISGSKCNNSALRIFKNESNVSKINKWWTSSNNKSYDQVISDYCFFKG